MHRGNEVLETDLDEAQRRYLKAIEADDSLYGAWFDLGLIAKWRQQWADCLAHNQRAAAVRPTDASDPEPAFWKAGIAATALLDWDTAAWAWRSHGIPLTHDGGPIEENFGLGVVRLPHGETVWGTRIDPVRLRVLSVPLPESGFRSDDIVLHDGEPVGSRVSDGREYSVFNTISRWQASPAPTISVHVEPKGELVDALVHSGAESDLRVENWTDSVVVHCKACSYGRVDFDHPDHDHDHSPASTSDEHIVRLGFAGEEQVVRDLLARWVSTSGGTVVDVTIHD